MIKKIIIVLMSILTLMVYPEIHAEEPQKQIPFLGENEYREFFGLASESEIIKTNNQYQWLIEKCKRDLRLRGSIEDKIRKNPTGFSAVTEEGEKKLKEELKEPLNIFFSNVSMSKDGKYLFFIFYHHFEILKNKEENIIFYVYSIKNKEFIGKRVDNMHMDY